MYRWARPCRILVKQPWQTRGVLHSRIGLVGTIQHIKSGYRWGHSDARSSSGASTSSQGEGIDHPLLNDVLREKVESLKPELKTMEEKLQTSFDLELSIRQARLVSLVSNLERYDKSIESLQELKGLLQDESLAEEAEQEIKDTIQVIEDSIRQIQSGLLPPEKLAESPALIEIRPGVGGDEAGLFVADILGMYQGYCRTHRWQTQLVTTTRSSVNGGLTEAIMIVNHPDAYCRLRFEGGVHRVQRVPATETKGRVHTSTVAVVVLPHVEEKNNGVVEEQAFGQGEIRIDVMRARGAGGQHVNMTESAVRITHIPTGTVVCIEDSRSQHTNKAKAFLILRARLAEQERKKHEEEERKARACQVSSLERSDKVRTYNYPQNRVSDHRCGVMLHNLESLMSEGQGLDSIIDALRDIDMKDKISLLLRDRDKK